MLASAELDEGTRKRPSVQIGDPFEEKKLLECCLELLDRGLLASLQDLGAAGLTSSAGRRWRRRAGSASTSTCRACPCARPTWSRSRSWSPSRRSGCSCVVEPGRLEEVLAVCERWEVRRHGDRRRSPTRAGCGCSTGRAGRRHAGRRRWWTTARSTTSSRRHRRGWIYARRRRRSMPTPSRARPCSPCSARPTSPQALGVRAVRLDRAIPDRAPPESADAAVLAAPDGGRRIAVAIDGNGRRVACDPYRGAVEAVLECAQNLACVGAEPLGLTNCLNFGNPEKPHVAWQLDARGRRARRRLPRARRAGGRAATSRSTTKPGGPDLPDSGRRHGRRAARPPPPASHSRGRGNRASLGRSRRRWPDRSWQSCAANRRRASRL